IGRGVSTSPTDSSSPIRRAKCARWGIASRTVRVRAFWASVHSRTRSEPSSSSQRYGSARRSPCTVSTTSSRLVGGAGGGAAVGALAFALVPLITLVLAAGHGLERITPRALAGGALAAVGVGIVFRDQLGAAVGAGALLALLAGAVCAAESGVLVKYFPRSHPAATSATGMAAGTALLFAISLGAGERWGLPSQQPTLLALLYLVASTVGLFATSLYVLGRWSASATAYQFVLFPLVTVVAAALLAGEGVGAT